MYIDPIGNNAEAAINTFFAFVLSWIDGPLPIVDILIGVGLISLAASAVEETPTTESIVIEPPKPITGSIENSIGSALADAITDAITIEDSIVIEKDSVVKPTAEIYIYRHRGTNIGNLRPSKNDVKLNSGLSFTTIYQPNSFRTTINKINSTGVLYAVMDKPYHVSVYPVNGTIAQWRELGIMSIRTQALLVSVKKSNEW